MTQHLLTLLLGLGGGALLAKLAAEYIPGFVSKEVDLELEKLLAQVKDPAARKFMLGLEKLVDEAVPDQTDESKYAILTDMILKGIPADAIAARPVILAVLSGIGAGVKKGIEEAEKAAGSSNDPSH